MNPTRIAALVAVLASFALADCGGGSTGVANATGQQAYLRVLYGLPGNGPLDIYFQSTGTAAPSVPIVASEAYAVSSDYLTEPAAAGTLLVQNAGGGSPGSGAAQLTSCPLPQLANNGKYSIVIARANSVVNCIIFQDFDYTGAPQYRFHDASPNAGASMGYGVINAANAPVGTAYTIQGIATLGNAAAGGGTVTTFTQATPVNVLAGAGANNVTFAKGPGTAGLGGTEASTGTISASRIFGPNSTAQNNTSGSLNVSGTAGTSVFAVDCTAAAVASLAGVSCVNGTALIGQTDSK